MHDTTRRQPISDGSLTPAQLRRIKKIHDTFSEVNSSPLRETIKLFQDDRDADRRIECWLKMAEAYERFTFNKHVEEHDKKEEAYRIIVMRSTTKEDEVIKKINARYLSEDEIGEVLSYYRENVEPSPDLHGN